jgi:glutamate synthase domain-containing protein 2
VRGAEDVFKHLALGADAVGIGSLALLGAFGRTADEAMELEDPEWTSDQAAIRLENLLWALQKELRLMLGAAGASSATTLVSSRELLRAVDLDPDVRRLLDVKPAGR